MIWGYHYWKHPYIKYGKYSKIHWSVSTIRTGARFCRTAHFSCSLTSLLIFSLVFKHHGQSTTRPQRQPCARRNKGHNKKVLNHHCSRSIGSPQQNDSVAARYLPATLKVSPQPPGMSAMPRKLHFFHMLRMDVPGWKLGSMVRRNGLLPSSTYNWWAYN